MNRQRRSFLRALGAGCLGALAGCSELTGEGADPTDDQTTSRAPSGTEAVSESRTRTRAATAETPKSDATATDTATDAPADTTEGTDTPTETPTRRVDVPDEPRPSSSQFDPTDGFADVAPWLEDDDVTVFTVTKPTRRNLVRAVDQPTPRVVVFETSGTIDLEGERLEILYGDCWIAGQTAPSPGITLTRGDVSVYGDNCVLQHLRVRPGDAGKDTGWEPDSIRTGDGTENNVVDHCTATWSVDENVSPGYDTDRTTVTNCLIAEPLRNATHHKGPHNYGMLVGDGATNVTVAGNLLVDNVDRNPRLKEGTESVVANNCVFHFEDGVWMDPDTRSSVEGNVYRTETSDKPVIFGEGSAHVADNDRAADAPGPAVGAGISRLDERPLWPDGLERLPADETLSHNLDHAGARPVERSDHDRRVLRKIRSGEFAYVDTQDDVGGYPQLEENERELAVPDSGLRAWLREHARAVEP